MFLRDVLPGETVRARPTIKRGEGWGGETERRVWLPVRSGFRRRAGISRNAADARCSTGALSHTLPGKQRCSRPRCVARASTPVPSPIAIDPAQARRRMDFAVRREGQQCAPRAACIAQ